MYATSKCVLYRDKKSPGMIIFFDITYPQCRPSVERRVYIYSQVNFKTSRGSASSLPHDVSSNSRLRAVSF